MAYCNKTQVSIIEIEQNNIHFCYRQVFYTRVYQGSTLEEERTSCSEKDIVLAVIGLASSTFSWIVCLS